MTKEEIDTYLQNHLSEFRYAHSLRVALEAKKIASIYQVDEEKAYLVGLAHDVAHEFSEQENLLWVKREQLPLKYLEPTYHNILHSDIGACVAKRLFSFDDAMCSAIRYHTIGNIHMTLFDKVIFLADKIGRTNLDGHMEKVKELTYCGKLDEAMLLYFQILTEKLKSRNLSMHPDSLELIHFLENKIPQ